MSIFRIACAALVFCLTSACASQSPSQKVPEPVDPQSNVSEFLAYHAQLADDIDSGVIGNLLEHEKRTIEEQQRLLKEVLVDVDHIADLPEADRLRVFNAQETINGILVGKAENTPICRREHVLGSHRSRVVCMTVKEREDIRRRAEDGMWRVRQSRQLPVKQ